jgi:hypothetical protein
MTVAELIKALEQYPPGRDVFVAIEDRLEMVYFVELVLERSKPTEPLFQKRLPKRPPPNVANKAIFQP